MGLCVVFILIAIGLEVMLYESNKHQGGSFDALCFDVCHLTHIPSLGFKTPSVTAFHISTKEASQFLKVRTARSNIDSSLTPLIVVHPHHRLHTPPFSHTIGLSGAQVTTGAR